MEIVFPYFSSSTTVGTESWPRHISPPSAYRREAKEAALASAAAECHSFSTQPLDALVQQPSQGQPVSQSDLTELSESSNPIPASRFLNKKKLTRIVALIIVLALGVALYFTWHTPASTNSSPVISQQYFSGTSSNTSVTTSSTQTANGNNHQNLHFGRPLDVSLRTKWLTADQGNRI